MRVFQCLSLVAVAFSISAAQASVIVTFREGANSYSGTQDAEVDSGSPDATSGGSTTFALKRDAAEHAYIRFDSIFGNGVGQIPAWVTGDDIVSATLQIERDSGSNTPVRAFQLASDWAESTITWNNQPGGGTQVASNSAGNPQVLNVTASLKAWADGTANYGWRLDAGSSGGNRGVYASSEYGTLADRPLLTVEFVPEPATAVLLVAGGLMIAYKPRRGVRSH